MITLTEQEQTDIAEFVDRMLDAGKSSKRADFRTAYTLGKGGEQAVARFLNERYNIDASVDYDVYDGSDSSDLLPYRAEVKVMPHYGQWVAIPTRNAERIDEDEPIIIVKHHSEEEFEVAGWCFKEQLSLVEQGEKPWTQKADNMCLHVNDLSTDWRALCEAMGATPQKFTFSAE